VANIAAPQHRFDALKARALKAFLQLRHFCVQRADAAKKRCVCWHLPMLPMGSRREHATAQLAAKGTAGSTPPAPLAAHSQPYARADSNNTNRRPQAFSACSRL
jgi:hypothetical protein